MSVHQHTIVALGPGKFHCVICGKDLTALDLLVVVDEPTDVHVVLRNPTEEACQGFENTLGSITYVSDASEDNGDVVYTLYGVSAETVRQWVEQANVTADILDW